jgi:hypothetical protein
MTLSNEPTIGELMTDPLIRAVMSADHVDPHDLEALLYSLAPRMRRSKPVFRPTPRFDNIAGPLPLSSGVVAKPAPGVCGSLCAW